jgi:hypothetical protein
MPTKRELLDTIATTIADYRVGEIERPDVERWIAQFPDKATHVPMLEELDHLLRATYEGMDPRSAFRDPVPPSLDKSPSARARHGLPAGEELASDAAPDADLLLQNLALDDTTPGPEAPLPPSGPFNPPGAA